MTRSSSLGFFEGAGFLVCGGELLFEFARPLSVPEGLGVRGVDRCLQPRLDLDALMRGCLERRGECGLEFGGALLAGDSFSGRGPERGSE